MTKTNNNFTLIDKFSPLSEEERSIIFGTLLGDASIQKRKNSYRLKIAHGIDQKSYVMWLYNKLKRLCPTTQPPKETISKKGYKGIEFYLSSGLYLKEFHELFYVPVEEPRKPGEATHKKRVTQKLLDNLPMNPLVLATWFMDDGSRRDDSYSGRIATHSFPSEDCDLLCKYLDEKWKIKGCYSTIHTKKSNQFVVYLPATGGTFSQFVKIIDPIVREIPEMVYKLNEKWKPCND